MISFNVSGDSFEQAAALFSANYDLPRFVAVPSEEVFWWRSRASGDETMTLRSNQFMADMDTTIGSDEEIIVQWARAGRTTLASTRTQVDFQLGIPIMLPTARFTMRLQAIDPDMSVVHIDPVFLRSVAEELEDVEFRGFLVAPPRSLAALSAWRKTMALVVTVLLEPVEPVTTGSSLLLRAEMSRLVAIAMLSTFPYDSLERTSGAAGIEPVGIREAVEFVEQNAHLPIRPADIARAVGLSTRSLQHALRRYRETTPTALLQTVRLERVRAELRETDPHSASVATIARFWGFAHLGRFAGAYRDRYHESPLETLRRPGPPVGIRSAPTTTDDIFGQSFRFPDSGVPSLPNPPSPP